MHLLLKIPHILTLLSQLKTDFLINRFCQTWPTPPKCLKETQSSTCVEVVIGDDQAKTGQTIVVLDAGNSTGALPLDDTDDAATEGDGIGACEEGELPDWREVERR